MAPHSSTLAWKVPWMEEPGRLPSLGSLRVRHDCSASLSLSAFKCIGEENGNPLQCSCLENPRDGGAWWAAVYGGHRVRHNWSDLAAAPPSIPFPCLSFPKCNARVWIRWFLKFYSERNSVCSCSALYFPPLTLAPSSYKVHFLIPFSFGSLPFFFLSEKLPGATENMI